MLSSCCLHVFCAKDGYAFCHDGYVREDASEVVDPRSMFRLRVALPSRIARRIGSNLCMRCTAAELRGMMSLFSSALPCGRRFRSHLWIGFHFIESGYNIRPIRLRQSQLSVPVVKVVASINCQYQLPVAWRFDEYDFDEC